MEDYMQELKGQRIWMLWRFEIRKEKRTKVPRSALDGGPSGSDESWSHLIDFLSPKFHYRLWSTSNFQKQHTALCFIIPKHFFIFGKIYGEPSGKSVFDLGNLPDESLTIGHHNS